VKKEDIVFDVRWQQQGREVGRTIVMDVSRHGREEDGG
jgi:hypothetical protein